VGAVSTPGAPAARTRDAAVGERPATAPRAGVVDRAAACAALWHYGARVDVEEPDGFLRQLMAVIAAADPPHRARLGRGFSGLVAAAQPAEDGAAGLDRLRVLAGRTLCRSCLGIGWCASSSAPPTPRARCAS